MSALEVITRGEVVFSLSHEAVGLRTAKRLEYFEDILEEYEGQTIVICVERPEKERTPSSLTMHERALGLV